MSRLLEVVVVEEVFPVIFLLVADNSGAVIFGLHIGVDLRLAIVVRVGGWVGGTVAGGGVGRQPVGAETRRVGGRRRVVLRVVMEKENQPTETSDPEARSNSTS